MIDCKLDTTQLYHMRTSGNFADVAAEIGIIVNRIYSAVAKSRPDAAEAFKVAVQACVAADNSPVWEADSNVQCVSMVREVDE